VERFNLGKLNKLDFGKQYQIRISIRFKVLEDLGEREDTNWAWENMKENIKISTKESLGLYELKQHKPWFDKGCLRFKNKETG
jgi:hypothetical protein